jgi:tetratricopeptide (TPR) repeat protein
LARRAVDFDPLNADSWDNLGEIEFYTGQLDQAAADGKKALELNPDHWSSPINLTRIYLLQGRPQDALREIERVHYAPYRARLYALTYYALGRKKESDAALRELTMKYHASNAFEIATIYAFRNQTDEAFEWLDRAYAQRDPSLMSTKMDPLLKSLHNDPRFAALLKKLNLVVQSVSSTQPFFFGHSGCLIPSGSTSRLSYAFHLCLVNAAVSMGRRNASLKCTRRSLKA